MGLKKRSKANAEFNMSSLTDIIFLLLIFFMLTSSAVSPNALNLKMPGQTTSKPPSSSEKIDNVTIDGRGNYFFNGTKMSENALQKQLGKKARRGRGKYKITISPKKDATTEHVIFVMDIARELEIEGILALEK